MAEVADVGAILAGVGFGARCPRSGVSPCPSPVPEERREPEPEPEPQPWLTKAAIARRWSGVLPQHPPMIVAPASRIANAWTAIAWGSDL